MDTSATTYTADTAMMIRRPISDVFEAFVNPEVTTKFWFTKSTGKLEEGKSIEWTWEMYHLIVPVTVLSLISNQQIVIRWGAGSNESKVSWTFKSIGDAKTYISISNYDFKGTVDEVIAKTIDSKGGFTSVLAGLKAYLEHRIELNLIGDAYPPELSNS